MSALDNHPGLRRWAAVSLAIALMVAAAAWGYAVYGFVNGHAALGLGFLLAGAGVVLFGVGLYAQVALFTKFVNYSYRAYDALLTAAEIARRQEDLLRTVAESSSLSEWAKRIVHREKDYEYLRDTIHAAVVRQDWEAAAHLIADVDTEFGYKEAAARFRAELEQARKATDEERITSFLARFEKLCDERKWQQVHDECRRLEQLFPENQRILGLIAEIETRRQEVKQELLAKYEEAVRHDDIDKAHRLLFELDQYIQPREAEALKQSARGVFRARLEQIKTRFSLAVSYKQFRDAIAAGEQLMREFPNSGYAQEIAKLMPALRARAKEAGAAHAPVGTRSGN